MSKTHLVLTQVKNEKYREFYKKRREKGDFLILDNGAYEDTLANEERLCEAINYYRPNVVVLPDLYLGAWEESLKLSTNFAQKFEDEPDRYWEWMFVPQAEPKDENGWKKALYQGILNISPAWIGLSRNLVADKRGTIFNNLLDRARWCDILTRSPRAFKVHALGMQAGCLEELWALKHAGCSSVDSSCAVWRGWNRYSLFASWPDIPLDFEADELDDNFAHSVIRNNIRSVLTRC